jgi:hypothetical protein
MNLFVPLSLKVENSKNRLMAFLRLSPFIEGFSADSPEPALMVSMLAPPVISDFFQLDRYSTLQEARS